MFQQHYTKQFRFLIKVTALLMISQFNLLGQTSVHINSGNPAFPFPQFLAYDNATEKLDNLGTHNPVGVCHAEMERSIKEAYQIMMNRTSKPGGGVNGTEYLLYKSTPNCTEGDGYALLAAAAMADKTTFDGLWLWVHDNAMNNVTSYSTATLSKPYRYSALPGWTNASGNNSSADADFDIALALYTAYKQWGEFMGINDSKGNPISYKKDCIAFLKGLTDTLSYEANGTTLLSGDIGLDGYCKNGDSGSELTDWATDATRAGVSKVAAIAGPGIQYFDYSAPSYFNEFATFLALEDSASYAWNIYQFRRAAASTDWLMGELYKNNPKNIPFAGYVTLSPSNQATFTNFNSGEDFRLGWRTILNYVWHGNPPSTWTPATHLIASGSPNTFEHDIGERYAKFLWDSRQAPWNNSCVPSVNKPLSYFGPSTLFSTYNVDGSGGNFFHLNWIQGTGSPSAIVAQDYNLMAEMYRQCEIEFDCDVVGDGYLTSVPHYFDDFFRLLGMLVLTGNYQAPAKFSPKANMKVYLDVDKTCATKDEEFTYSISYRNYGSIDAASVSITDTLPEGLSFVSCTGGGIFSGASNSVSWQIGTVPGFKTATGVTPTTGEVTVKVKATKLTPNRYCNKATISCVNGTGYTSNEYPNKVSSVMKRNCVDIINSPLSEFPFQLHGGRPGVRFSFSQTAATGGNSTMQTLRFRMFHDAQESYINLANYRISYFLFDTSYVGIAGQRDSSRGWNITNVVNEGVDKVSIAHQTLTPSTTNHGKWNQRIIFQFGDRSSALSPDTNWNSMTTINWFLDEYRGVKARVHKGQTAPLRFICSLNSSGWNKVNWADDWSYDSLATGTDTDPGLVISPDFTNPLSDSGIEIHALNPKLCDSTTKNIDNILIEEWDGYAWRHVFGNSFATTLQTSQAPKNTVLDKREFALFANNKAISYKLSKPGKITLQIINAQGRVIKTLVNTMQQPGTYFVPFNKKQFGFNMFFIKLTSLEGTILKKFFSQK